MDKTNFSGVLSLFSEHLVLPEKFEEVGVPLHLSINKNLLQLKS